MTAPGPLPTFGRSGFGPRAVDAARNRNTSEVRLASSPPMLPSLLLGRDYAAFRAIAPVCLGSLLEAAEGADAKMHYPSRQPRPVTGGRATVDESRSSVAALTRGRTVMGCSRSRPRSVPGPPDNLCRKTTEPNDVGNTRHCAQDRSRPPVIGRSAPVSQGGFSSP